MLVTYTIERQHHFEDVFCYKAQRKEAENSLKKALNATSCIIAEQDGNDGNLRIAVSYVFGIHKQRVYKAVLCISKQEMTHAENDSVVLGVVVPGYAEYSDCMVLKVHKV